MREPALPALDPIEMAFAKLETLPDPKGAPENCRRIGQLLDNFTPAECANNLQAAGYGDLL